MFSYLYFVASIYFFLWWLILFFWKKEFRKEILWASILGMILGPLVELMHFQDWWHPILLYSFPVHIEDIFFGFSILGISAVIYQEVRHLKEKRYKKLAPKINLIITISLLGVYALFGLFYFFHISSFITSVLASVVVAGFILIKRPDLFQSMCVSGILVVCLALPFYLFALHVNPHWIEQQWYTEKLSGIQLLHIPIEELVWYFCVGFAFSSFWEFMCGLKMTRN